MVRWLLVVLVLANVGMWAWTHGWLAPWLQADREPRRLERQIDADRLRVVPPASPEAAPSAAATPASSSTGSSFLGSSSPAPASSASPSFPPASSSSASASTSPAKADRTVCTAFAPLDEERARRLQSALEAAGAEIEATRSEQGASYLVYLPPAPTAAEAQRRLAELRRIGRSDVFLIPDGPYRQAISLGIFRYEEAARALVARLAALGEPGALVAPRAPFTVRVHLQARWRDAAGAGTAGTLAAQFDAPVRDCG
ncbi:MAG: SPOR domain-containing protein [Burkholderiales bacterium]|mgnify:CR=1 FL=1|nr:SPOR domain-containing protein [Burkholderiales bacterium]OJX06229.1 MAG: hypothetical protein BGO72_20760 [Burkholderiales bacterium 70-64]